MVRGEAVSSSVIGKICLEQDAWKELFSLQKEDEHNTSDLFADSFKIIGFPFFNQENRMAEFEEAVDTWINRLQPNNCKIFNQEEKQGVC